MLHHHSLQSERIAERNHGSAITRSSRSKKVVKWFFYPLIILGLILIGGRLLLPSIVLNYVNRTLNRIPDYSGSVEDIDIWLIRGAYTIKNIKLLKKTGHIPVPFFSAPVIDLSVHWSALFEGKIVGEIEVDNGKLNFVNGESKQTSQTSIDSEWLKVVKDLFPLRINHFELKNSEIHYRDFHTEPKVDVMIVDIGAIGKNFSNTRSPTIGSPATIEGTGKFEKVSPVKVKAKVYPAAKKPAFDVSSSVTDVPLTRLNDFFMAYGNFSTGGGTFSVYTDFAAANNQFRGTVKPLIKDAEILSAKEEGGPLRQLWQGLVSLAAAIFENHSKDQIATEIPFSGTLDKPETSLWDTFIGILKNAFIKALKPGFDKSINVQNLIESKESHTK